MRGPYIPSGLVKTRSLAKKPVDSSPYTAGREAAPGCKNEPPKPESHVDSAISVFVGAVPKEPADGVFSSVLDFRCEHRARARLRPTGGLRGFQDSRFRIPNGTAQRGLQDSKFGIPSGTAARGKE